MLDVMREGMSVMLWLTLAPLSVIIIIGLVLSLLMSILQLQDQALPIAVKIVATVFALLALMPWMSASLVVYSQSIFKVISKL